MHLFSADGGKGAFHCVRSLFSIFILFYFIILYLLGGDRFILLVTYSKTNLKMWNIFCDFLLRSDHLVICILKTAVVL